MIMFTVIFVAQIELLQFQKTIRALQITLETAIEF